MFRLLVSLSSHRQPQWDTRPRTQQARHKQANTPHATMRTREGGWKWKNCESCNCEVGRSAQKKPTVRSKVERVDETTCFIPLQFFPLIVLFAWRVCCCVACGVGLVGVVRHFCLRPTTQRKQRRKGHTHTQSIHIDTQTKTRIPHNRYAYNTNSHPRRLGVIACGLVAEPTTPLACQQHTILV